MITFYNTLQGASLLLDALPCSLLDHGGGSPLGVWGGQNSWVVVVGCSSGAEGLSRDGATRWASWRDGGRSTALEWGFHQYELRGDHRQYIESWTEYPLPLRVPNKKYPLVQESPNLIDF